MNKFNPVLYKRAVLDLFDTFDLTPCEAVMVLSKVAEEMEALSEIKEEVPVGSSDAPLSEGLESEPSESMEEGIGEEIEEGPKDKEQIADEIVSILKREFGESIDEALDLLEGIGDLILSKGEEEQNQEAYQQKDDIAKTEPLPAPGQGGGLEAGYSGKPGNYNPEWSAVDTNRGAYDTETDTWR